MVHWSLSGDLEGTPPSPLAGGGGALPPVDGGSEEGYFRDKEKEMSSWSSVGPILILFLGSGFCAASAEADLSVEGKKILLMDDPPAEEAMAQAQQVALDGLLIGGPMIMFYPCKQEDLDRFVAAMRKRDWGRLTDNFWVCWSYAGEPGQFDWFDDMSMIVNNFRMAAAAAKQAGFKGLAFDPELYGGVALFRYYEGLKYFGTKSLAEYQEQVFQRGAEIMRAINESFPDITVFFLFGGNPAEDGKSYADLLGPFIDGFLSECGPQATVVDGCEEAYYASTEADLAGHRARIFEQKRACSRVPERYRKHLKAGLGIWPDAGNKAGMSFDLQDFRRNYRTPEELAYTLHQALRYSDEYVWLWRGSLKWLEQKVTVIDERGKFVDKPLPAGYLEALQRAREPQLALPPARGYHDGLKGMRGVIHASDLPGWSDEEAFEDLWAEFELVTDLPLRWRFALDPQGGGVKGEWFQPAFDDARWPEIAIKEFWEHQGEPYRYYDGVAWYRTTFTVPSWPAERRLYLAFGAVNDEAVVYVDGQPAPLVEVGRKGPRFLVEVTGRLKPGATSLLAVQVTERGGLGGIWKNVKLVAARSHQ